MSAGLPPQPVNQGPSRNGAPIYHLAPQSQHQLSHEAFPQLATCESQCTQRPIGQPYPAFGCAPAPVPPPQPPPQHHPQYQPYYLTNSAPPRPVESAADLKVEAALLALEEATEVLPTRQCPLAEWITHEGRVLNFLHAFALLNGDSELKTSHTHRSIFGKCCTITQVDFG